MKKTKSPDTMRDEYTKEDLGVGVREKYYKSYTESRNFVLLEPEVAKVFSSDEAVNQALLSLINIAQSSTAPALKRKKGA